MSAGSWNSHPNSLEMPLAEPIAGEWGDSEWKRVCRAMSGGKELGNCSISWSSEQTLKEWPHNGRKGLDERDG